MNSIPHPYVYICTNLNNGQYYIGYREANSLPAELDFPSYRTSNPHIKREFKSYAWTIIAEFLDGDAAYDFEQQLIFENWENPLLINKFCFYGKRRFKSFSGPNVSESTRKKISDRHRGVAKSQTHKEHISTSLLGHQVSQSTKTKIQESRLQNPIPKEQLRESYAARGLETCPHCGKVGASMIMQRWHFARCRHKSG